ncbi:hypothetical protein XENORESO_017499 [Xenotaenia resolanae]|uniref:Uncharacterized protein n=1 Tax=Xenotaenia resolanae TaxID=208358 RepID=A0ABV0VU19_9TELE
MITSKHILHQNPSAALYISLAFQTFQMINFSLKVVVNKCFLTQAKIDKLKLLADQRKSEHNMLLQESSLIVVKKKKGICRSLEVYNGLQVYSVLNVLGRMFSIFLV